jgi:hypothetical protein
MRQAIGIAVFAGMLGVTTFGLFLTPVFFVTLEMWLARGQSGGIGRPLGYSGIAEENARNG